MTPSTWSACYTGEHVKSKGSLVRLESKLTCALFVSGSSGKHSAFPHPDSELVFSPRKEKHVRGSEPGSKSRVKSTLWEASPILPTIACQLRLLPRTNQAFRCLQVLGTQNSAELLKQMLIRCSRTVSDVFYTTTTSMPPCAKTQRMKDYYLCPSAWWCLCHLPVADRPGWDKWVTHSPAATIDPY